MKMITASSISLYQFGMKLDSRFARVFGLRLMLIRAICIIIHFTHSLTQEGGTCGQRRSNIRPKCSQFAFFSISRFVHFQHFSATHLTTIRWRCDKNGGNSNLQPKTNCRNWSKWFSLLMGDSTWHNVAARRSIEKRFNAKKNKVNSIDWT